MATKPDRPPKELKREAKRSKRRRKVLEKFREGPTRENMRKLRRHPTSKERPVGK